MFYKLSLMLGVLALSMVVNSNLSGSDEKNTSVPPTRYNIGTTDPNSDEFAARPESVRKALAWLKKTDLKALSAGRYEIDNDNCYAMVQEYTSRTVNENTILESHQKYIDIQMVLEGEEFVGWVCLTPELPTTQAYSAEKDVALHPASAMPWLADKEKSPNNLVLRSGDFVILDPKDVHAPGLALKDPQPIRKLIVKCRSAQ